MSINASPPFWLVTLLVAYFHWSRKQHYNQRIQDVKCLILKTVIFSKIILLEQGILTKISYVHSHGDNLPMLQRLSLLQCLLLSCISRNLVTIYRKYCNLIGYYTRNLSGARCKHIMQYGVHFPLFRRFGKGIKRSYS